MQEFFVALSQAIDGLLVQSETDAPLSLFVWPEPLPFTSAALLAARGLPVETTVETYDLARFFGPRARLRPEQSDDERATALRFQHLQTLLEAHLTDIRVLRLGTIEITVWIAGQTSGNRIVGLTTLVVET